MLRSGFHRATRWRGGRRSGGAVDGAVDGATNGPMHAAWVPGGREPLSEPAEQGRGWPGFH